MLFLSRSFQQDAAAAVERKFNVAANDELDIIEKTNGKENKPPDGQPKQSETKWLDGNTLSAVGCLSVKVQFVR